MAQDDLAELLAGFQASQRRLVLRQGQHLVDVHVEALVHSAVSSANSW